MPQPQQQQCWIPATMATHAAACSDATF